MSSERIVVALKHKFIGDAVLATPLLRTLAARYEQPHVLVAPHIKQLLSGEPGVQFIESGNPKGWREFLGQLRSLRKGRFDVAVLVNRNFRSALLAKMARIPRRIGFPTEGRAMLLTDRVPYDPDGFESACYARLGEPLGLEVPALPVQLTLSPTEIVAGRAAVGSAVVGLQPGSSFGVRAIPPDHAARIANVLTERGFPVALFGGKEERHFAEALLPLLKEPPVDLVGKCSLRETMAALSRMRLFIAGDTGLVHTSAALGVRTITTFGVSQAAKWGHAYEPHSVYQAPEADMRKMDVEAVIAAALEKL